MLKSLVIAGLAAVALAPSLAAAQTAYDEEHYGPPPGAQLDPNDDLTVWKNRHDTQPREQWMEQRINHRVSDGSITQAQADRDMARLSEIKAMDDGFRRTNGGPLTPDQRRQINLRLEHLADTILAEENRTAASQ